MNTNKEPRAGFAIIDTDGRIIFTGNHYEKMKKIAEKIEGILIKNPAECKKSA